MCVAHASGLRCDLRTSAMCPMASALTSSPARAVHPTRHRVFDENCSAELHFVLVKEIAYSRAAVRTLARMPRNLADRVRDKIRAYAIDPASQAGNIRRLRGTDRFLRLRVGGWRIVMRDGVALEILHITTRGHAYRD